MTDVTKTSGAMQVPVTEQIKKLFENRNAQEVAQLVPYELQEHIPIVGPPFKFLHKLVAGKHPARDEVLDALRDISSWGGDSERIDAGYETQMAAELFSSDDHKKFLPAGTHITETDALSYFDEYQHNFWDRKRDDVLKNYGLEKNHRFSALSNSELCVKVYGTFRGLNSFEGLSDILPDMVPRIRDTRKLNVLYPGSGFHIAPLATAMHLIDDGIIDEATFTYTEIEDYSKLLGGLLHNYGMLDPATVTLSEWKDFGDQGKERELGFVYKGHPIRIIIALKRSGEEFYREEYLKNADLVIIHDPLNGFFEESADLLAKMILQKLQDFPTSDQAVIMEGVSTNGYHGPLTSPLPKDVKQHELPGPYGHCTGVDNIGEVSDCVYKNATTFLLGDPALQRFASSYPNPQELSRAIYKPPIRISRAIR